MYVSWDRMIKLGKITIERAKNGWFIAINLNS